MLNGLVQCTSLGQVSHSYLRTLVQGEIKISTELFLNQKFLCLVHTVNAIKTIGFFHES